MPASCCIWLMLPRAPESGRGDADLRRAIAGGDGYCRFGHLLNGTHDPAGDQPNNANSHEGSSQTGDGNGRSQPAETFGNHIDRFGDPYDPAISRRWYRHVAVLHANAGAESGSDPDAPAQRRLHFRPLRVVLHARLITRRIK